MKVVHVKHKDLEDGCLINESDFDPKKHELFTAPVKELPKKERLAPKRYKK